MAADDSAELDRIAAELYALTPDEFTAARDARASEASEASDRGLAKAITGLRKPVVAAWVVGELARTAPEAVDQALDLGAQLREAQHDLDAAALQALNRQRRALVSALAEQAADAARARGVTVSPATLDAVAQTLNAAMRDAGAAAAVRSGRLQRPLEATGIDAVDLDGAVAGSLPPAHETDAERGTASPDAATRPPVDLAARRARKQSERAAREAERAASDAERELTRLDARLRTAREHATLLDERVEKLRAELDRVAREADTAADEIAQLDRDRAAAASVSEDAAQAAADARAALED